MKKVLCYLLAGVLLLSLTACKKPAASDQTPTDTQVQTPDVRPDAESLYKDFLDGKLQATDQSGEAVSVTKYENASEKETKGKYAFCDMNGDAVPELIVKTPWYFDIYTVKDGFVQLWHENAVYCNVLNNGALLYERPGGGPSHVFYKYILLDAGGKETYKLEFAEYIPDKDADHVYHINGAAVDKAVYEAITGWILNIGQEDVLWKRLEDGAVYVADYWGFLADLKAKGSEAGCLFRDMDGNGTRELVLNEDAVLTVYTLTADGVTKVDAYDYGTGTFRTLSSDDPKYPGVLTFWLGGGANHFGYMTVKDGKLSHERLWDEVYSLPENDPGRIQEFSADKDLIGASKTAYAQDRDLRFQWLGEDIFHTDGLLLQVLHNEKPFTVEDGKSVLLKDYKVYGTRDVVVDRYAWVDFDGDGVNELVAYLAPDLAYMVFHIEHDQVYGYEFGIRHLMSLKADGTHYGSGGAANSAYCALSFKDGKYEKHELAYHDGLPGVENSSVNEEYRVGGKSVTPDVFSVFYTAFKSKPDTVWHPYTAPTEFHAYTLVTSADDPGVKILTVTDTSSGKEIQTIRLEGNEWFIAEPIYTDITFDGNKDILVPADRPASTAFFAGYIWNEKSEQYVYAPYLENIPNIALDAEKELLLSHRTQSMIPSYGMYRFDADKMDFEPVRSLYWEAAENDGYVQVVEHQYTDGQEAEVKRFLAPADNPFAVDKTDANMTPYYEAGSVWDLDGEMWRNTVYTPK